jgi:hypothetical protein
MHMTSRFRTLAGGLVLAAAPVLLGPPSAAAQSTSSERWLHVRVISTDSRGETVRVNVPLELAEKVLPAINKDRLHDGKVRFHEAECDGVDFKAVLNAVRTSKDGEFVTVQGTDGDVRVAKQAGYLLINVTDKSGKHHFNHHRHHISKDDADKDDDAKDQKPAKAETAATHESKVEVKVPMKVVDALFSAGKDELDVLAALRALSANGDTELVSVKADDATVRVWLDSKNVTD